MSLARPLAMILAALVLLPGLARGQDLDGLETGFSVERFRLSSDSRGVLDVESGEVLGHLALSTALWLGYADDPLNVYRDGEIERERVGSLISHRLGGELVVALGLFNRLQIGAAVPVILSQDQAVDELGGPMSISSLGLGSIELVAKMALVDRARAGFDLSGVVRFGFPTSGDEDYFGDARVTVAGELVASAPLTPDLRVGLNIGALFRDETTVVDLVVNDELSAHAGLGYMVHPRVELDATVAIATGLEDFFASFNQNAAELRGGVTIHVGDAFHLGDVTVFAASGAGISQGFGTPDWRLLLGARFAARLGGGQRPLEPRIEGEGWVSDATAAGPRTDDGDSGLAGSAGAESPVAPKAPAPVPAPTADNSPPPAPGDRDADGVIDSLDNCPETAGSEANAGCADEQLVRLTDSGLVLLEKVYFKTNESIIDARSYHLLRNIAEVLAAHPELTLVRVEGHTDDRGSAAKNLDLSQRRADAVRNFLIAADVAADRLEAVGRGEEQGVADNSSEEGRAQNRRVELVVVKRAASEAVETSE